MKLVMVFVDAAHAADVARVLEDEPLPGYSEFTSVLGKGATGRRLGTRAFPGTSTLFVAVVPAAGCRALVDRLSGARDARSVEEGLKIYALDAEELL